MTTEFAKRLAECAARGHRWESDACTVHGITFQMTVCTNCGVTARDTQKNAAAVLAFAGAPGPGHASTDSAHTKTGR